MTGRKKPYTEIGIQRVPCARCGKPSFHQWQACANNRRYVAVCIECDVTVNEVVLNFFKIAGRRSLLAQYKKKWLA